MTVPRNVVQVRNADLRPGDRFRDGWTVRKVLVRGDHVTIAVGKVGHRRGITKRPTDGTSTVSRRSEYVRWEGVNRATGTTVQVLDLAAPGSEFEPETTDSVGADGDVTRVLHNRWATCCLDHSILVTHPTLDLARSHVADPLGWCGGCVDAAAGCTCSMPGEPAHSGDCPLNPDKD